MKRVMRVKETNRYFFTQNPNQPAYFYPEKSHMDERTMAATKENDQEVAKQCSSGLSTTASEAVRDYNLLFGD